MIYVVRGKQVMLSSDVAVLYRTEAKIINQVVKRNINRFPESFCFQLTNEEYLNLRSQIVTSSLKRNNNIHGGIRYLPYVFTEHGIMMLSSLLKSDIAISMNVKITEAFVAMKKYISSNLIEQKYINNLVIKHDEDIKLLQSSFDKLNQSVVNNHIFFEGQIYDAYSLMLDILNRSKINIIIIDNYVYKVLLDILAKIDKKITIITNKYNNEDYNKYKKQYSNINLKINNTFHDRFIIIDKKELYHCGASFKDLGKKCFAITKIEDKNILKQLLENSSL
ncbi:MAG: ORF6N domain-containing protein [bacterium]|nr:ORF6N domain-containing protein [bacterium]